MIAIPYYVAVPVPTKTDYVPKVGVKPPYTVQEYTLQRYYYTEE